MGAYVTWTLEALAFGTFVVLAVLVPYARRKRDYWTSRGLTAAAGYRSLANTLPGVRLHDRSLSRHRDDGRATGAAAVGLYDGGRPVALACDFRVAAAALGNDGFAEEGGRDTSLVPSAVNAGSVTAVLPTMAECVAELITSLEAVANRRLTVSPWTEVKNCATTVVATCVYGQPMVDSRIKAFAEQCAKALSQGGGGGRSTVTDYFATYDLSLDGRAPSTDFKQIFRAAATDSDKIDAGE